MAEELTAPEAGDVGSRVRTRRRTMPTTTEVLATISQWRDEYEEPLNANALAIRLRMSSATLWRHFPEIAKAVANRRRHRKSTE